MSQDPKDEGNFSQVACTANVKLSLRDSTGWNSSGEFDSWKERIKSRGWSPDIYMCTVTCMPQTHTTKELGKKNNSRTLRSSEMAQQIRGLQLGLMI